MSTCASISAEVAMYYIFFIQSPTEGHLGCFYVLALVNNAVRTMRVHMSVFQL